MDNKLPTRWIGTLCVLLAACSSTDSNRMSSTDTGMQDRNSSSTSSSYNTPGSTASTGTMSNSTAATSGAGTAGSTTMAQTSYGVVQAIDQVMRQDVGVGAVGAAAAGGTMGSPTDKVYRVKLKLDDGTEQTVVVDSMPTYQVGDRIRYSNGSVQRY